MPKLIKPKSEDPFSIKPDCLFFSDLHLADRKEFERIDPKTGLNVRLLEGLSILDQIIEITQETPDIRMILHLGDVFELKDKVPNHILIEFQKKLNLLLQRNIFTSLLGNHDFNLQNYPTLSIFKKNRGFHFIDHPQEIPLNTTWVNGSDYIYFIPFQRDYEDFKKEWKEAHKAKPEIICLHQELPGAIYESGKPVGGIWDLQTNPEILYLSGHLHKSQKVHGVQYLGSPYPTKFLPNDDGNYYIWLFNSKTRELRPLQLNYSKFIIVDWHEFDTLLSDQIKELVNENYIKITGEFSKEDIGPESKKIFKENLEKLGAKAVVFNIKIKHQTQTKEIESTISSDQEVIQEYAKQNKEGFDLDELTKVGENIYESI